MELSTFIKYREEKWGFCKNRVEFKRKQQVNFTLNNLIYSQYYSSFQKLKRDKRRLLNLLAGYSQDLFSKNMRQEVCYHNKIAIKFDHKLNF